jgi:hypothetical protein
MLKHAELMSEKNAETRCLSDKAFYLLAFQIYSVILFKFVT